MIVRFAEKAWVAASHENPLAPGVWKKVMLAKGDLRPGVVPMVNWARLPAGSSFAPHYHEDMQEVFIIVDGPVEMSVGIETVTLGEGDAIVIDPGEVHQMRNPGGRDVQYLVFGVSADSGGRTVTVEP